MFFPYQKLWACEVTYQKFKIIENFAKRNADFC